MMISFHTFFFLYESNDIDLKNIHVRDTHRIARRGRLMKAWRDKRKMAGGDKRIPGFRRLLVRPPDNCLSAPQPASRYGRQLENN